MRPDDGKDIRKPDEIKNDWVEDDFTIALTAIKEAKGENYVRP